ncbi:MAG: SDR family oxidoreductase [Pseudomonadota bacterium]
MPTFDPTQRNANTIAVITGGSQGLGLAVARQLMAEGCTKLALAARSKDVGEAAATALCDEGADVIFVKTDMIKPDDTKALIDATVAHFGDVNALVNCAATTERGTLEATTPEVFDRIFAVNVRGSFFAMQAFTNHCLTVGHGGSVVNILSTERHCGKPFLSPYSGSKAAMATITKNAANAFKDKRIRFNAVAPGWMDTPAESKIQQEFHGAPDDWLEKAEAEQSFGQLIKPEECAGLIAYLVSPQGGVMTGACIDHDQHVIGAVPEMSA